MRFSVLSHFASMNQHEIEIVCQYPLKYNPFSSRSSLIKLLRKIRIKYNELIAIFKLLKYLAVTDCFLWIEKGEWIPYYIFKFLSYRNKTCIYLNDNFTKSFNVGRHFSLRLKQADFLLCADDYYLLVPDNIKKLYLLKRGAGDLFFKHHSYKPSIDAICFVGSYELERYQYMLEAANHNLIFHIYGNNWPTNSNHSNIFFHKAVYDDEFIKVHRKYKVYLNFVRKSNNDLTTSRSYELLAMRVPFISEYSESHEMLYKSDNFLFRDSKDFTNKLLQIFTNESYYNDLISHLSSLDRLQYSYSSILLPVLSNIINEDL